MARYLFPQDATAFLYTGPGEPIRQPWTTSVTMYVDQACTTLADIQHTDQTTVLGSILYLGADGMLPQFLGPADGTAVLWAKPINGTPYPVTVQLAAYMISQLQALQSQVVTDPQVFTKQGPLTAAYQSPSVLYNDSANAWSVVSLRATVGTAPTGGPITVTLRNETGLTAIGSVSIPAGQNTALFTPSSPYSIAAGEGVTVSIDAVGSTVAGSDLIFQLNVRHPVG